jgi:hypothetical protein
MDSGASGENANDDGQAGAGLRAQAEGAPSSTTPRPKDYLVNDAIGKALQAHFRSLADAPLPDRFLRLLAELEAKDSDDDK